ncbi:MAG: T9SS type A sorting domain-containing protein [Candidatus Neomarinimicrobiota bacterium]|jgi:hypothetical protein
MNALSVKIKFVMLSISLFSWINSTEAQYVDQWGQTDRGTAWPILNNSSTVPGNASIGLPESLNLTTWATIRGGFSESFITETDRQAVIISGQLEFIGGDVGVMDFPSPFRFALTFQDSATLQNQYTDSAMWVSPKGHYGYEFTPKSGNQNALGGYAQGSVWTVNGDVGWNSTYLNNGWMISMADQFPRGTEIVEGVYDWAISIEALSNSTNEIRWYLVEQNYKYWSGGVTIDTAQVSTKFNGICFGILGLKTSLRQLNLNRVKVEKGDPIAVPEAPWNSCYVSDWGIIGRRTGGWRLTPGVYSGNVSIGADVPNDGWVAIRGEFPTVSMSTTEDSILLVQGQMEFVNGGFEESGNFRFGLFYSDSAGTLIHDATTDSMLVWSGIEDHHSGYLFIPTSGDDTPIEWPGINDLSTHGAIVDGTWWRTDGENNYVLEISRPMPAGAIASAGIYSFDIAIQLIDTDYKITLYLGNSESNYCLCKTVTDRHLPKATDKFNCIAFALNGWTGSTTTAIVFSDILVSVNKSFKIPGQKYMPFYIEKWGFLGNRFGGWNFSPQSLIGDAGMVMNTTPTEWAALRGEFDEPIQPRYSEYIDEGNALTITGSLELSGSDSVAWHLLKFGIFHSDSTGELIDTQVDSTRWSGTETHHSGYLFIPPPEARVVLLSDSELYGTWGGIIDKCWLDLTGWNNSYFLGSNLQYPPYAVAGFGLYHFGISVHQNSDYSREIRFSLVKDDSSYIFAGMGTDNCSELANLSYNCFNIAIDFASLASSLILKDVIVKYGVPINIPNCDNAIAPINSNVVKKYSLSQNYPNPFNASTIITYQLPKESDVKILIYNINGQLIQTLVDRRQTAGFYSVKWNSTGFASGIYFYQFKAGDFRKVRKCMLIK